MKDLQERVKRMLNGEAKRRDVALQWINEVQEILEEVAEDIWGTGDIFGGMPSNTITLERLNRENNKVDSNIYFRYVDYIGPRDSEYIGFYENSKALGNIGGKPISELQGKDFWLAVRIIMDWIPQITKLMDEKEAVRNALTDKLNLKK